jgi:hypothetical protein
MSFPQASNNEAEYEALLHTLQEMCWLLTLKIRHKIVIMVDFWRFYDEKIIVKNGASLMIEHDKFTEIVITVHDDIWPS